MTPLTAVRMAHAALKTGVKDSMYRRNSGRLLGQLKTCPAVTRSLSVFDGWLEATYSVPDANRRDPRIGKSVCDGPGRAAPTIGCELS